MGELLCHMWLLGLPCSLGGDEWLRDNIFYLFIRFSLMNKNRKCGWDHSIAPLSKKKIQPLAEALKNFLFLSVLVQRAEIFFHPSSLIHNCDFFFFKLNWHKCLAPGSFSHLFKVLPLQPCFWSSGAIHRRSTHICNGESGSFYPPKWDPFWCDIWENYQCMGEQERG